MQWALYLLVLTIEIYTYISMVLTVTETPRDVPACRIDLGFVLDGSGSVTSANWDVMLSFVRNYVRQVSYNQSGTRIGVVSYGNEGTVNIKLNDLDEVALLERTIMAIPYKDENTNTASGIRALRTGVFNQSGDRPDIPNIAILITDGASTWEKNLTLPEAEMLRNTGTKIFALGVGSNINNEELNGIAGDSYYVTTYNEFNDLYAIIDDIVLGTCDEQKAPITVMPTTASSITTQPATTPTTATTSPTTTTTTTTTSTTTTPKTTTSTTTLPTTTTSTTTTPKTTTPKTTTSTTTIPTTLTTTRQTTTTTTHRQTSQPSGSLMDIAFILDSSGSIGLQNWEISKRFVMQLVQKWPISSGAVRVAVICYSTEAFVKIELGSCNSYKSFDTLMRDISHHDQRTNTSGAIRLMRQSVLNETSKRPGARQVAIVVTDGDSNTDQHLLELEGRKAREQGVYIFAVGVGNDSKMSELQHIASLPYYHFIYIMPNCTELLTYWHNLLFAVNMEQYPSQTMDAHFYACPSTVVLLVDVASDLSNPAHAYIDGHVNEMITATNSGQASLSPYKASTARGGREPEKNVQGEDLSNTLKKLRQLFHTGKSLEEYVFVILTDGNYGNPTLLQKEIYDLKEVKAKIVIMPVGGALTDDILKESGSEPKNETFYVVDSLEKTLRDNQGNLNYLRNLGQQSAPGISGSVCKLAAREVWSCSFENGARCNTTDDIKVEFTWTVQSLTTPSDLTGPDSAYLGQYYAYIEASDPRQNGDRAVLYLPVNTAGAYCLSFHYHMYGHHIGILDVFVSSGSQERITWRMSGEKGNKWLYGQTLVQLTDGSQIGIRGIRAGGHLGDLAIDALRLQAGPCLGDV